MSTFSGTLTVSDIVLKVWIQIYSIQARRLWGVNFRRALKITVSMPQLGSRVKLCCSITLVTLTSQSGHSSAGQCKPLLTNGFLKTSNQLTNRLCVNNISPQKSGGIDGLHIKTSEKQFGEDFQVPSNCRFPSPLKLQITEMVIGLCLGDWQLPGGA